ncbi:MAG: nucleoside triphosphate pyrophosphohydrolase family protein [Patescibacteria group bacterium]|nr:nucleoside triphosphate pyrophosphohydrolase family protein [Patescibacteria group bacterium]
MHFQDYQKQAKKTAVYPNKGKNYIYPVLGLTGEAGEVAEKFKKIIRDNDGKINSEKKAEIEKELGDVLWYISQISTELKINLEDVAKTNIKKLSSRLKRNCIKGDGDNR